MMPSNRLALLAILALGYLGLLSTHVSEFATLFALLVEQCVALGVLSFFVPLNIRNNDELTRTIRPDPGGPSSLIQVRANRPQFSIGAIGVVIGTSTLTIVHYSVEIVAFIRTATIVVVQTSILLQVLLGFLVPFLLPSFITSRLIKDQD
jgi:hypothetical protein